VHWNVVALIEVWTPPAIFEKNLKQSIADVVTWLHIDCQLVHFRVLSAVNCGLILKAVYQRRMDLN